MTLYRIGMFMQRSIVLTELNRKLMFRPRNEHTTKNMLYNSSLSEKKILVSRKARKMGLLKLLTERGFCSFHSSMPASMMCCRYDKMWNNSQTNENPKWMLVRTNNMLIQMWDVKCNSMFM